MTNPDDMNELQKLLDEYDRLDEVAKGEMRLKLVQVLKNFESSVLHCFRQIASSEKDEVGRMAAQKAYRELVELFGRER